MEKLNRVSEAYTNTTRANSHATGFPEEKLGAERYLIKFGLKLFKFGEIH